jgi:hypothetical protein
VSDTPAPPLTPIDWSRAVRIVRSIYPPIDLFEDIADPADWALLISAEQKTNPRLMETIGNLDLVPLHRRISGAGASYLMSPFTHISVDRPSRFSDGTYGALYAGDCFEVALLETMHHHARFMANTRESPGWTSQFREVTLSVNAHLHDARGAGFECVHDPNDYHASQSFARDLRDAGSDGITYRSVRHKGGHCVALFYPDLATNATQARHLDYHWNGKRVDMFRVGGTGEVFAVVE